MLAAAEASQGGGLPLTANPAPGARPHPGTALPASPAAPPPDERALPRALPGRLGALRRQARPAPHQCDPEEGASSAPSAPAADLRPLTRANAVGRHVLVPHAVWPGYPCEELAGRGWRAVVVRLTAGGVKLRFATARTARGQPFADEELELSVVEPI